MTLAQILVAIAVGLTLGEFSEVCPWAAGKLVRWSARHRYVPPARAELRAEELTAYINERPGKLLKLITALGFVAAAIVTGKVAPGVPSPTPLWWPTTPIVPVRYKNGEYEHTVDYRHPDTCAMCQARRQLEDKVHEAAREMGLGGRSWRHCIKKIQRITTDERWILIASNLTLLKQIDDSRETFACASGIRSHRNWPIPTDSTVMHYRTAVETTRAEVRRLTNDFLLRSAPN